MLEPEGIFVGQMREWIVIEPRVSAAPAGDANPSIDTANAASNATATNRGKRDVSISILLLEQRPPIPPAPVHTGSPAIHQPRPMFHLLQRLLRSKGFAHYPELVS